jgi:hypothetical protein
MKRVWVVAAILSFISVTAGFAQAPAPSVAPLSAEALAAILGPPADTACPEPQESVVLPDQRQGVYKTCSASATCNDTSGVPVSCSFGGAGGSCTFTNQNCAAGIRGSVNCQGSVTQCPVCPCGSTQCCICASTGDCFACCRCDGGGPVFCRNQCEPFP